MIEHVRFLLVHSGYNIVVGKIWGGGTLLVEVLHLNSNFSTYV